MPELPEVETTLRGIKPHVQGAVVRDLIVRNPSLRWPVPVADLESLIGYQVYSVERRAKYLLLETEAGTLLLHLGMSGSLRVFDGDKGLEPGKHDHVDLILSNGYVLRLNDPRRFGCCLFVAPDSEHSLLDSLGPEPLTNEFSGEYLFRLSRKRTLAVKNFVMDGKVVVGVGNIYASESLYQAGIIPTAKAGTVSRVRYEKLAEAIKEVLNKAINAGGTTLSDFSQVDGKPGYFKQELRVYGQEGESCKRCDNKIESQIIGQRNTFYCPKCQK